MTEEPKRIKLRSRRPGITTQFCLNPFCGEKDKEIWFTISIGFVKNVPVEVFASCNKTTDIEALGRDACILISLALQHGCSFDTMRHAITREAPSKECPRGYPSTLVGLFLDHIETITPEEVARLLNISEDPDELEGGVPADPPPGPLPDDDLVIVSIEEKPATDSGKTEIGPSGQVSFTWDFTKPIVTPPNHLAERFPGERWTHEMGQKPLINVTVVARTPEELRQEAQAKGYTGEACRDCFNFTLVRNGTCFKCNTCGSTSGCS